MEIETTKVSSKGQIVLPVKIRQKLSVETGDTFVVYANDDSIVLKKVTPLSEDELNIIFEKGREYAIKNGIKKSDIPKIIKTYRKECNKNENSSRH